MVDSPNYAKALEALQAAHDACFRDKSRDVLGMSHGPFSGVNVALGIIVRLEAENKRLRQVVAVYERGALSGSVLSL